MPISARNLWLLAGELAAEHGVLAREYARRAYAELEAEGESRRAHFWLALSVLVDDIIAHRGAAEDVPTIH